MQDRQHCINCIHLMLQWFILPFHILHRMQTLKHLSQSIVTLHDWHWGRLRPSNGSKIHCWCSVEDYEWSFESNCWHTCCFIYLVNFRRPFKFSWSRKEQTRVLWKHIFHMHFHILAWIINHLTCALPSISRVIFVQYGKGNLFKCCRNLHLD